MYCLIYKGAKCKGTESCNICGKNSNRPTGVTPSSITKTGTINGNF